MFRPGLSYDSKILRFGESERSEICVRVIDPSVEEEKKELLTNQENGDTLVVVVDVIVGGVQLA